MHDSLARAGLRRMRWWVAMLLLTGAVGGLVMAALVTVEPEWPLTMDSFAGAPESFAIGAGVGLVGVLILLGLGSDAIASRRAWPKAVLEPAPELVPVAEGIAIARGLPVPRVWRLASPAPNVACLRGPGGIHFVVSTAAERGFPRDELEALMALQLSLLVDDDAHKVRRPLVAASRLVPWVIVLMVVSTVVLTVADAVLAGLTVNIAIWLGFAVIGLVILCQRRIRWSWGIVGDAVALETTRYPEPLIRALRRLAGYNGDQVRVARSWGAADPFWAAPVRRRTEMALFVTNGRAQSRRSTEQVSDVALLLRAGIVERVRLGGEPATLASWKHARAVFNRVGRASGDYDHVDGRVDGVVVTTEGATVGALGPVATGPLYHPGDVQARRRWRPWRPDRRALAAYDEALARGRPVTAPSPLPGGG